MTDSWSAMAQRVSGEYRSEVPMTPGRPRPSRSDSPSAENEEVTRALFAAIEAGDTGAFAALVEGHGERLHAYAARMLGDSDAAQDVVQEVLIRVWQKRGELSKVRSPQSYLYRITRNMTIDRERRLRSQTRRIERRYEPIVGGFRAPDAEAELSELALAIEGAIDGLSPRRKEVFVLAHLHDMSYREIGEVTGLAPRTVANYLVVALKQVRAALGPVVE